MCPVTLMHTLPVWHIDLHRTDEGAPFLALLLEGSDKCLVLEPHEGGKWRLVDPTTDELIWAGAQDQLPLEWRLATLDC